MASRGGRVVLGVDVLDHDLVDRRSISTAPVDAEDAPRSARPRSTVPVRRSRSQIPIELASSATSSRASRRADRRLRGGELQLGDDAGRELLEQLGLVVGPVARLGVVDGQRADDVPGRRDQRRAEVGPDLARGDGRQVGDPLVLGRARGRSSGAPCARRSPTARRSAARGRRPPRAAGRSRRRRCPGR